MEKHEPKSTNPTDSPTIPLALTTSDEAPLPTVVGGTRPGHTVYPHYKFTTVETSWGKGYHHYTCCFCGCTRPSSDDMKIHILEVHKEPNPTEGVEITDLTTSI
jgi:hypothetical protein